MKNTHGGVRNILSGTKKLRKLSDKQLIELLTEMSNADLAKKFETNSSTVSLEITKRKLFDPNKKNKNYTSTIKIKLLSNEPYSSFEDKYGFVGEWGKLKKTGLYKQIMNK